MAVAEMRMLSAGGPTDGRRIIEGQIAIAAWIPLLVRRNGTDRRPEKRHGRNAIPIIYSTGNKRIGKKINMYVLSLIYVNSKN